MRLESILNPKPSTLNPEIRIFWGMKHYWMILGYGLVLATGILLLRNMEIHWLMMRPAWEVYSGALALIFLLLGFWLAPRLNRPPAASAPTNFVLPDGSQLERAASLGISERELEVLQGMAEGLSNAEIAEKLFLSTHTIKSHASRIFEKLDVKRRTQAIQKGKELGLI